MFTDWLTDWGYLYQFMGVYAMYLYTTTKKDKQPQNFFSALAHLNLEVNPFPHTSRAIASRLKIRHIIIQYKKLFAC